MEGKSEGGRLIAQKIKPQALARLRLFFTPNTSSWRSMQSIIRDLVSGKMNIRKLILWAIAVLAAIPVLGALWAICLEIMKHPNLILEVAK
jgi:hypothetical protein